MPLKVLVLDDVTEDCDLRQLVPYPTISSVNGSVTITPTVSANGQTMYDLAADVDVNVSNFSYNPANRVITLTETDGQTHQIDISDLVDTDSVSVVEPLVSGQAIANHSDGGGNMVVIQESLTSFTTTGTGFTHTNEAGTSLTVDMCDLIGNIADNGLFIGG